MAVYKIIDVEHHPNGAVAIITEKVSDAGDDINDGRIYFLNSDNVRIEYSPDNVGRLKASKEFQKPMSEENEVAFVGSAGEDIPAHTIVYLDEGSVVRIFHGDPMTAGKQLGISREEVKQGFGSFFYSKGIPRTKEPEQE